MTTEQRLENERINRLLFPEQYKNSGSSRSANESWGRGGGAFGSRDEEALDELLSEKILYEGNDYDVEHVTGYYKVTVYDVSYRQSNVIKQCISAQRTGLRIDNYKYSEVNRLAMFYVNDVTKKEYEVYKSDARGKKGELLDTFGSYKETKDFTQKLGKGWVVQEYQTSIAGDRIPGTFWGNY